VPLDDGDVGHRVVLRRHAGTVDGRARYTDVLGELRAWGEEAVVRTASGEEVAVPRSQIAAAKRVPPPPPRREPSVPGPPGPDPLGVEDLELERIAALGWRGLETARLGGWELRAGGGFTGRANSVLPLGDPGVDLDEALERVVAWYAERGLPARVQVPLPARAGLHAALLARGWREVSGALVQVATCAVVLDRTSTRLDRTSTRHDLPAVRFTEAPDEGFLALYRYRGGALPPVAVDVLRSARQPLFAAAGPPPRPLAVCRAALDEGWVGITAVEVAPEHRRRGLGTHLMREVVAEAVRRGARAAYLQVADDNAAGTALYQRLGFLTHHRYRYLVPPPG